MTLYKYGQEKYAPYEWTYTDEAGNHIRYFLKVNGVDVTTVWNPITRHKELCVAENFIFHLSEDWDGPSLNLNDRVEFYEGSKILFKGWIIDYDQNGVPSQEGVIYNCYNALYLLESPAFEIDSSLYMVYNPILGEVEYGVNQDNKTCGEIIKDILDCAMTSLSGKIDGYIQTELNAMDVIPPRIDFSGLSTMDAIREVCKYQMNTGYYVDASDNYIHFVSMDKDDLTEKTIDYSTIYRKYIKIKPTLAPCINTVKIQGRYERERVDHIYYDTHTTTPQSGSSLTKGWNTDLESAWTPTLAEDDPEREDNGKVFRYYNLSKDNLLPNLIYAQNGISILEYNPVLGEYGNWHDISAKVNLRDGVLKLSTPSYLQYGINYYPLNLLIRYAYIDTANIPEVTVGPRGSAYTTYGWNKVLPIYDQNFKKQEIRGIVTGVDGSKVYDASGSFTDDFIGLEINGTEITDCEDGWITASGHGLSVGDEYSIPVRDDTSPTKGMSRVANLITSLMGDEFYIGELAVHGLEHNGYELGQKINISNTGDTKLASMQAPLRAITWNYKDQYKTILNLSSGFFYQNNLNYDELKRRLTRLKDSSKQSAWVDVSVSGSNGSSVTGETQSNVKVHTHADDSEGGNILKPSYIYFGDNELDPFMQLSGTDYKVVLPLQVSVITLDALLAEKEYKAKGSKFLHASVK